MNSSTVVYNGAYVSYQNVSVQNNRAFKLGDGVFETIKVSNHIPLLLKEHLDRLFSAMKTISLPANDRITPKNISDEIKLLLKKNDLPNGNARVRITVFRDGEGAYLPITEKTSYLIEAFYYNYEGYFLNKHGKKLDLYHDIPKYPYPWNYFKTINSQLYISAAMYAKDHLFDDVLIKNDKNEWIESTNSNLFIVYKGSIFTPALESGCVAGVMRTNIINLCLENGFKIFEHAITEEILKKAEEVFLTNSINGVSWVGSFKSSRYFNKTSVKLTNLLNKQNANFQLDF